MTEIPAPINHTVTAIYEAIAKRRRGGDSDGVPMSDCVAECDRAIWYGFRWASPQETVDGERASRFETGEYWEQRLIEDLQAAGVHVERFDPATGKQHSAVLADGFLRGKLDGLAQGLPEAPQAVHVVECKSLKQDAWRAVVKHGLAKAKPDHYAQCQCYMRARGLDRCLYLAVCKNTDERHAERIRYDPLFAAQIEARILRIVKLPEPPARLHEDATAKAAWQCGLCRHKAVCQERAFARVNCRTCLHASVGIPFACGRNGDRAPLPYTAQQIGCEGHRYIPALVPYEQIDVIHGDCVVYQKPDGDHWIDGEGRAA